MASKTKSIRTRYSRLRNFEAVPTVAFHQASIHCPIDKPFSFCTSLRLSWDYFILQKYFQHFNELRSKEPKFLDAMYW
jgi:hypothetical protein